MLLFRIVLAANIAALVCAIAASPLLGQQTAAQSLKGLTAAEGLEVSLWAAEPQLVNPTNIDIDERGRVWVLEAVNYRRKGQKDFRPAGDRITILEDTDGDGRADKMKVFDQNPALRAPLGIAVLGNKVIVSQSPDIIVYTKDEHDKIIDKQVLLTGWHGVDRDHGLHAVTFGPDGRLYFTVGDAGFDVTDRSGKRVASSRGGPYYAGTTLRMNPDGSGLTVMGHNFRNPYESAIDSFGTIWQTDNDDDGYAWVRVNYVMEGGNFGYWGPGGRSWREDKGSHFHAERPGVVPNLARTGAGSPSGLVVYEGALLPEKYRGSLIHAETGKRLINTYSLSRDGAGYSLKTEDTVKGGDTWFRPTDVAVSPDGTVFVSDWYDAVVGGNQMHDIRRGRIYRIAPAGYKAKRIKLDFESPEGLTAAFRSPAQSVRYLARTKLKEQGEQALPILRNMWRRGDRVLQARALWLLAGAGAEGRREVEAALAHEDPDFRTLAIRVLRAEGTDIVAATRPLLRDPSPQVRREVALALQHVQPEVALDPLTELSRQYDGKDRWYLEALGIAARRKEDLLYTRLREVFPEKWNPLLGRLLWEFRPPAALPYLIERLSDAELDASQRAQVLEVLSAMPSAQAGEAVAAFIGDDRSAPQLVETAFDQFRRQLFSEWIELRSSPLIMKAIRRALNSSGLQARALELIDDLGDAAYGPDLLVLAKSGSVPKEIRGAAIQALGKAGNTYAPELERLSSAGPLSLRLTALRALGFAAPKGLEQKLKAVIGSPAPNEFRAEAVRVLGRSERGLNVLLDLQASGALPPELKSVASAVTNASRNPLVKLRAEKLLPLYPTRNRIPLRPLHKLAGEEGDVEKGKKIFDLTTGPKCASCHSLGGKRKVGPDLSGIGGKLGKVGLIDSILNPSAGIAPEYTVWILETKTQGQVIGILREDTPQRVVVGADTGEELRLKPSDIASRRQSRLSMMPEDLINTMTEQQLIDVVQYLTTLRDPGPTAVSNGK